MAGSASGKLTLAVPVAKLTVALTPSSLLSFFSTRAAHEAQVIPPIASSPARTAPPGAAGLTPATMLIRASPLPSRCHVQPGPFGKKIFRPNGPGITPGPRLDLAVRRGRPAACSAPGELVVAGFVEGVHDALPPQRWYQLTGRLPEAERPVVFVGRYEHHSNELPWRESIADVVVISEDADGHINLADLARQPDYRGDGNQQAAVLVPSGMEMIFIRTNSGAPSSA